MLFPRTGLLKARAVLDSSTDMTLLAAASGSASAFYDLVLLILTNTSASPCTVQIFDNGVAGTPPTADNVVLDMLVKAGDTMGVAIPQAPIPQGTANKLWTVQAGTSVSAIYVNALFAKRTNP